MFFDDVNIWYSACVYEYSDKNNIFECDIQLEGASLSQAFARVIVESKDLNLILKNEIKHSKIMLIS